jgi:uncharacterized membrane protein
MNKQLRILLAGAMVVIPVAITVWVIWAIGSGLDNLVKGPLNQHGIRLPTGAGALIVIGATYLVGLMMRLWIFRGMLAGFERLVVRVPGVKTIYESVRDLMKLFGSDSHRMGRVVQYTPPGTDMVLLGILTNERPKVGLDSESRRVAVYLPYSYMFGGLTIYVSPEHLREVDMPVEQALKLSATAQVGATSAAGTVAKASKKSPPGESKT